MRRRARAIAVSVFATIAGLVALYALLGFVVAPYVVERKLPDYAARLGLRATVEDVNINPFLLTAEARGLAVHGADGAPLLAAPHLAFDLDLSSAWRRTWIIDSVEARGVQVRLVRTDDGLNVAQLLAGEDKAEQPSGGGAPPLIIERATLRDATLVYEDRTRGEAAQLVVGPLDFTAEHFSTLSGEQGRYELTAVLPQDATFSAKGTLQLEPLASSGTLELQGFHLATLVPVAVDPRGYSAPEGELGLQLQYTLSREGAATRLAVRGLEATLAGLSVKVEGADAPIVAVSRLAVAGATIDLAARTVTADRVQATDGTLSAIIDARGNLNLAQLAEAFNPSDKTEPPAGEPWHVRVGEVAVEDVALQYADHQRAATLRAGGDVASASLSLAATVGDRFAAQVQDLALALRSVAVTRGGAREPVVRLSALTLDGGRVNTTARQVSAARLVAADGAVHAERDVEGSSAMLAPGTRPDRADAGGLEPIADALRTVAYEPAAKSGETAPDADPWHVTVEDARVKNVAVRYADRALPVPLRVEVNAVNASLQLDLTAGPSEMEAAVSRLGVTLNGVTAAEIGATRSGLTLQSLALQQGALDTRKQSFTAAQLEIERLSGAVARDAAGGLHLGRGTARNRAAATGGEKQHDPGAEAAGSPWHVSIGAVTADAHALQYADRALPTPLRATIGDARVQLALAVATGKASPDVEASGVQATVKDFAVAPIDGGQKRAEEAIGKGPSTAAEARGTEQAQLGALVIQDGRIDTAKRFVGARRIALNGPRLAIARTDEGRLRIAGVTLPESSADQSSAPGKAWSYALGALELENGRVAYADRAYEPAIAYDFTVDASASNVESGAAQPARFHATVVAAQGGTLQAEGTAAQTGDSATARLRLDGFKLEPLDGLLRQFAAVDIASGTASANAEVRYDAGPDTPLLVAEGGFAVTDVLITEPDRETRVASWRSVDADTATLTLAPNRLEIDELHVTGPEAKLVVSEKRRLNLTRVLHEDDEGGASPTENRDPAAPEAERASAAGEPFPVRIGRVSIADGTLDFADLSLVLPFSTRVHALRGVVVGLSTAPGSRAELKLEGEIADYGSASARGGINPTDPTAFMDISAEFNNVRLPPLSPYTATFAGRIIESGRLWLDVDYRILDRKLSGENKIVLQNIELGRRVEAPNAMDLPLELAVGLLKDSKGRITLAIPVSGNVGDPEFDYGAVIRKAIGNVLQRIVTAPFRALASLFKGKPEDVQVVQFDPGSDRLTAAEEQQLDEVARALRERPGLRLKVSGPYDPERDARVLREQRVRRSIAAALGNAAQAEAPADPVAYSDPQTQTVLQNMLKARLSAEEYDRFRAQHPGESRAHYEAAFDELVSRTEIPETELRLLGARRARAIADQLAQHGIDRSRIASSQIRATGDTGTRSVDARLDLQARSD